MTTTDSDEFRNDGALANVLTGMGVVGKDKTLANTVKLNPLLSQVDLEELYKSGLIRRYVDAIPEAILRHRPTITLSTTNDDLDLIPKFNQFLDDSRFAFALMEAIQLQRLYGGSGLVLLINDGGTPEDPVNINRIRSIGGYIPLSRHELIPENVTYTDYHKPEFYRITTAQRLTADQTEAYVNVKIHQSRVARFDGLYLPWNVRSRNTGWGMSVVEVLWDAWQNYYSALAGLGSLLSEGDLLVHKMPGLMQRVAAGGEADIRKRLELNNLARSVYGIMVIDAEESVENLSRNLTNLSQAIDPFVKHLQSVTGWPASILMGDSPGGLGKEGRFEERVWASLVEQWQDVYCRTPITEIFRYILASKDGPTRGRVPDSWEVMFPSVFVQTDEEKAALRNQIAQSDNVYVQMGSLNALEIRQSRFGGTEFSIETQLEETITEQISTQVDMQFQQQMAGFDAQMQAAQGQVPPEGDTEAPPPDAGNEQPILDSIDAHGLTIQVTHKAGEIKGGYLIAPDGQRVDSEGQSRFFVFGPHRNKSYNLYRARFVADAALIEGPYVGGFASMKAAKQGVKALYPRQTVAGLSVVPASELEALRAGWETY